MSSYFKALKSLNTDVLTPAAADILRSAPDSLFLGTALFALITQSFPLGIFTLAMAEMGLLGRLIGGLIRSVQGNEGSLPSDICTPGIPSPFQISIIGRILPSQGFPSAPVFFLTSAITQILASSTNFTQELKELGNRESEWKTRLPLSYIFGLLLLIFISVFRAVNGCESVMAILGSLVFGGLVGLVIFLVHLQLFGRDSVNFLGIPLLADRAANGRPLQVCSTKD